MANKNPFQEFFDKYADALKNFDPNFGVEISAQDIDSTPLDPGFKSDFDHAETHVESYIEQALSMDENDLDYGEDFTATDVCRMSIEGYRSGERSNTAMDDYIQELMDEMDEEYDGDDDDYDHTAATVCRM